MSTLIAILVSIPVCAFLNRARGGGYLPHLSGINGTIATLVFASMFYFLSWNFPFAICFFLAYLLGESFGWSKWINCIPGHLTQTEYNKVWLGRKNSRTDHDLSTITADWLVDESKDYELYCFVGMMVRGLMWWVPVFAIFYVFGAMSLVIAILSTVGLSVIFPIIYRVAYQNTNDKDKYIHNAELLYGAAYGVPFGIAVSNLI